MKTDFKERRKYKRALFSIDQGLVGQFALNKKSSKKSQPLSAPILDISRGGIGFVLDPCHGDEIHIDDSLALTRLAICVGGAEHVLAITPDLPMTVRGKIAADFLSHVGIGCDFSTISIDAWEQIKDFIRKTYPNCIV